MQNAFAEDYHFLSIAAYLLRLQLLSNNDIYIVESEEKSLFILS